MHDATKVLMGATRSSSKQGSESFASSPLTYIAGLAVRRASTNLLSLTKSAGLWVGISLGRSLSDIEKTDVLKAGEQVPVLLEFAPATATATITAFANLLTVTPDTITVDGTAFVAQAGAATLGTGTFQAATSNNATATSLAAQINAHATASTKVKAVAVGAVVTLTALVNTTAGNAYTLAYTDNSSAGATISGATFTGGGGASNFVTKGAKVYFSNTTGKADAPDSDATISDAIYVSGVMTGIGEDGVEVAAAIIDMPGGL
jgi:hypothetical protein